MGFRIATNIQSIAAQRSLGMQRAAQNHQMEKLAAGERIVRAGDDAAGLAISEKFRAELRSTRQAVRNSQDGISMVQVAEGGVTEIGNMLIRMRELSIQSASDTIGDTERTFINREVDALKIEIERITQNTRYNGVELLTGNWPELEFQVGVGSHPTRDRTIYNTESAQTSLEALGLSDINTMTKTDSQENLDKLDVAIGKISEVRAEFGALQNRLQSTINNLAIMDENLSAANSRIRDADFAAETAELTKTMILTQAGTATLAQANQNSVLALKLL